MAKHGHQWCDPRTARYETERAAYRAGPDKITADWATQSEAIAHVKFIEEVRRNFAVLYPLDGQDEQFFLRWRSDRIAALRLIPIVGGESDIDMLTGQMSRPTGRFQQQALHARRLDDDVAHFSKLPLQLPGRGHDSVAVISLLLPGIAVVVISE